MQAQIAEENGAFRIEDVFEGVNRKLIRRHPHVFGSVSATTPDAVIATWEGVKASERAEKGEATAKPNPIDRLPRAMPATRKVVEILAPRTRLAAPEDLGAGNELLEAICCAHRSRTRSRARARSVAAINRPTTESDVAGVSQVAGIETERGRESA